MVGRGFGLAFQIRQITHHTGDVAGGFDVVLRHRNRAVVDDERGTNNALDLLAIVILLAECSVSFHDLLVDVGKQREVQVVVLLNSASFSGLSGEMPTTSMPSSLS